METTEDVTNGHDFIERSQEIWCKQVLPTNFGGRGEKYLTLRSHCQEDDTTRMVLKFRRLGPERDQSMSSDTLQNRITLGKTICNGSKLNICWGRWTMISTLVGDDFKEDVEQHS
jgi:hypothetical protein